MQNSRTAYLNLTLATLAFAVAFAAWSVISPLSKVIQSDLKLDNTSIALLIAVPTLLGALMRIPMGILADRFGGRKVMTALLLFLIIPIAFLGFANSYWTYVLDAFFLGTAGASFAVGIPFVSRWFTADRQGTALGIYGIGNIGTAISVMAMGPLCSCIGRQGAFWFFIIPLSVMAVVFWLFARDAPGLPVPLPLGDSFKNLAREPQAWNLMLFYFVTFGGFVFFANYLPQLLGDWFPADRRDAGLQAAIFTVGATLARPAGGWLADQLGGEKVLVWVFAFVLVTRLVLAWESGNANMVIVTDLLLLVGIGFGLGNGAVFKLVAQYFPKQTGLMAGLVGCAGGLGGFFPPIILGFVKDQTGSYALGFILLSSLAAFCLAVLLARPATAKAEVSEAERFTRRAS
ncbi:MAG: NarK/NasA family nitrate transporter [Candidatus Eremiobacteraeota bacterium]|nr:NarK/NasA family nitrate transporter [Candidatus Eremiobacteraeota bacterium]MBV8353758.1 NarK/NasA family nitrate transporter [Candidatus Eremiobacteraeota bacterium]